jgi:hypothetical protein
MSRRGVDQDHHQVMILDLDHWPDRAAGHRAGVLNPGDKSLLIATTGGDT